jgi:hypothetical protein
MRGISGICGDLRERRRCWRSGEELLVAEFDSIHSEYTSRASEMWGYQSKVVVVVGGRDDIKSSSPINITGQV